MNRFAEGILKHRKTVLILFIVAALISAVLMAFVHINYNLSDYLPDDSPSTKAMNVMQKSFDQDIPNVSVYIENVTVPEALSYKSQMASAKGVKSVLWLDDVADTDLPLEVQDQDTVEAWYKDGGALFSVTVDNDTVAESVASLREIIGDRGLLSGDAVNRADSQTSVSREMPQIMLFVIPLVLVILLFSTSSWFEPVLFLITIGVAILINEGTNIVQGQISFVTRSTSAVLQLAVSMDYAVFLLHRFARHRQEGMPLREAMAKAMVKSFSAIAASAATTVLGFLVLALMRFKIGPDMGFILAKGVLISFISVVVLLPVLALAATKLMDKTHHRPLLPSFNKFGKFVLKVCIPLAVVVLIMVVPAFLAQRNNQFVYGSSGMLGSESRAKQDADKITGIFGESQQMALLVPQGNTAAEAQLSSALKEVEDVKSVISYDSAVGSKIPSEILTKDQAAEFRSGGYSRMIVTVATPDEGDRAFRAVENVRNTAGAYYGEYHLLGQSVVNYDLKNVITADNLTVAIAAVVAIGIVLLITFRSLSIPLLLLLAIEAATWINLGMPYFTGDSLNYIGYQIISSVQLGATVDYGILFTQHYMENRRLMDKKDSARTAVSVTAASILTPAGILTIAGIILGIISSNGIISQLGFILGRGAAITAAIVLLVLPALLMIFDRAIEKTTLHASFIKGDRKK